MNPRHHSSPSTSAVRGATLAAGLALALSSSSAIHSRGAEFRGRIVDAESGEPLAARIYLQSDAGEWLFVATDSADGSAIPYKEQWVATPGAVELHTTVSAHPFKATLPAGRYTLHVERGKEHLPLTAPLVIRDSDPGPPQEFPLRRWSHVARQGWHSGETHVHRRLSELPNVMLAEDLNVAFPVTFWTIDAGEPPGLKPSPLRRQGPSPFGDRVDAGAKPIHVDERHVIFPRNTEYEIFRFQGRRHTLGALFILNHQSVFRGGMPPVRAIAEQAHREGALLDLDKHSWPWAMMLAPVARVDLFELSNNSVWRTEFGFRRSAVPPAPYMNVEQTDDGEMTERGWLNFGFENYYTLLNCGFPMQPTAGTASGVHPVPLGFSRVYVHTGDSFDPQRWLQNLRDGRSFVTTGPMLDARLNGRLPGERFQRPAGRHSHQLRVAAASPARLESIEVVVNGRVAQTIDGSRAQSDPHGVARLEANVEVPLEGSSWIAVRCFQKMPDGRVRFAHTAPWHVSVDGQPLRPRREEVDYLVERVRREIARSRHLLSPEALQEFQEAQQIYESRLEGAVK